MGNGRKAKAPCGHMGECVIGTYVACKKCDAKAVPKHIEPEDTEPMWLMLRDPGECPRCKSKHTEYFASAMDGLSWYASLPTFLSSFPPEAGDCGCCSCGKIWTPVAIP